MLVCPPLRTGSQTGVEFLESSFARVDHILPNFSLIGSLGPAYKQEACEFQQRIRIQRQECPCSDTLPRPLSKLAQKQQKTSGTSLYSRKALRFALPAALRQVERSLAARLSDKALATAYALNAEHVLGAPRQAERKGIGDCLRTLCLPDREL